jgi:G:T-mismatch repair DNA endonuclease (very short patch repair protein)
MPTGYPGRRKSEEGFQPRSPKGFSKVAHGWLQHEAIKHKRDIRHAFNGGEVRIGLHSLPVDGYCSDTNTVYQFHGCYWHGHPCDKNKGHPLKHPTRGVPFKDLYKDTLRKEEYMRHLGYNVYSIWECEWEKKVNASPDIKAFLRVFFSSVYPQRKDLDSLPSIIESIKNGKFFGFVECDISVPDNLREKFSEMAPIFKNVKVSRDQLSEHMLQFAEENDFLKTPQRMLIGSLYGEKILLLSELAKWYLEHGLEITKVYQLIEYEPREAFRPFGESVSTARRQGDVEPDLELLATTNKLVGNSSYGKTITNKEKHRNVRYVDGSCEASAQVRGVKFVSMEEIDEDFYEIVTHKQKVRLYIDSFEIYRSFVLFTIHELYRFCVLNTRALLVLCSKYASSYFCLFYTTVIKTVSMFVD